ncbi:MAG: hypothetical protein ACYC1Q_00470 [Bacteroidia bacterium]
MINIKRERMKIIKACLAVISGIVAGSVVNAGLIFLGNAIFGSPEGMDLFDPESVKAHADKLTAANFVSTLFAHQMGTLVGAFVAAMIAPMRMMLFSLGIGVWFLLGGIYAASLIPAPTWFIVVDFVLYLPFAFIGGKLAEGRKKSGQ